MLFMFSCMVCWSELSTVSHNPAFKWKRAVKVRAEKDQVSIPVLHRD